jgi:membrane-associated protease RseP (regulator of RpoE activity)
VDNPDAISAALVVGVVNHFKVVSRNGTWRTLGVTPVFARLPIEVNGVIKLDEHSNPTYLTRPVIGVGLSGELVPVALPDALAQGFTSIMQSGQMVAQMPQKVGSVVASTFAGAKRDSTSPVSVLGLAKVAGKAAADTSVPLIQRFQEEIYFLASVNFALFAFNLLPLLPLDGGHVAGAIYESIKKGIFKLRRKPSPGPADTALLMPLAWFVGLMLLALGALFIVADIVNPISL